MSFKAKVKVRALHPVLQPGSCWVRLSSFVTCGSQTHPKVTVCDARPTRPLRMYPIELQGHPREFVLYLFGYLNQTFIDPGNFFCKLYDCGVAVQG